MMNHELTQAILANPLTAVADYYASCLAASGKAIAFIRDELKLTPEQAVQQRIGFADRSLGTQLPSKRIKSGREVREQLISLGLYKGNGRETLRGYVTVPVVDGDANVIGIRGVKIDQHASGPATVLIGNELVAQGPMNNEATSNALPNGQTNQAATKAVEAAKPAPTSETVTTDELTIHDNELIFQRDDRRYRIRGLEKNASLIQLKVNLMASRDGLVHLDTLDLVKARSRASFIKAAASELYVDADTIKKDIGRLLLQLETLHGDRIAKLKNPPAAEVQLSDEQRRQAMDLLQSPHLLQRIVSDIDTCGMVGEATNKLVGYLAATSRKLETPLAIVIQSSSAAGKTSLMDAILTMMPGEDVLRLSGMTGQSLFYLDSDSIRYKILGVSEDEGIAQVSYALKLLQSEGELHHATVGRGDDGRAQTQLHHVKGPVQIFFTTTAMDIDEELVNRCLVLSVDETDSQTDAIQCQQRRSCTSRLSEFSGNAARLRQLHQNAQRLLRPLLVINPYADQLTFPSHKTRMRRDHLKYLTLIDTIALLHQHQRKLYTATHEHETIHYIQVEIGDIAAANRIAGEVLGQSLDELSPQTRRLLGMLHRWVSEQVKSLNLPRDAHRFTRRDLRESIHWSDSQLSKHLQRLIDLEYVLVHRGRNGQRYVYELLYGGEGCQGQPFLMGLVDSGKLQESSTMTKTSTP